MTDLMAGSGLHVTTPRRRSRSEPRWGPAARTRRALRSDDEPARLRDVPRRGVIVQPRPEPISPLEQRTAPRNAESPRVTLVRGSDFLHNEQVPAGRRWWPTAQRRGGGNAGRRGGEGVGDERDQAAAGADEGSASSHSAGGSAAARDTAMSKASRRRGSWPASSARTFATVTLLSSSRPATWSRNAALRASASSSVTLRSGRRIAMTAPGIPAPEPTSTIAAPVDGAAASSNSRLSSIWRRHPSGAGTEVRLIRAFQRAISSRNKVSTARCDLITCSIPRSGMRSLSCRTTGSTQWRR